MTTLPMRNSNYVPEISIILPVYNVEPYLERCLDSILNQTFPDWEAVCVDDGSTDRCPEILERYAAADPRFRVFHKPNGGVSSARNYACGKIRGKYALMIDSDDLIHPQLMEICLHFAQRDDADLVCYTCDRRFYRQKDSPRIIPVFKHYETDRIRSKTVDNIFDWVTEYSWRGHLLRLKWTVKHCQPWRCLYRSSIIRDLRFPEGIIFEDLPWWGEVLLQVRKTVILNLPLYFYSNNSSGYLGSTPPEHLVRSMRTAIRLSEESFAKKADARQQALWEKQFLAPFRKKLMRREKRYAGILEGGPSQE